MYFLTLNSLLFDVCFLFVLYFFFLKVGY